MPRVRGSFWNIRRPLVRPGSERCQTLFGVPPADQVARARDLDLSVAFTQDDGGQTLHPLWTVSLRNRTGRTLRLVFPSTKYADAFLRRNGRLVYEIPGSFPAFTARTLAPHASYVCTIGPVVLGAAGLEPGRYEWAIWLNAGRARLVARGWFTVVD